MKEWVKKVNDYSRKNVKTPSSKMSKEYWLKLVKEGDKKLIETNALIARFMGYEVDDTNQFFTGVHYYYMTEEGMSYSECTIDNVRSVTEGFVYNYTTPAERRYDNSWDMLKPVIEKIGNIEFSSVKGMREWMNVNFKESSVHLYSKIDVVYDAVVNFIKWYNDAPNRENELKNKREVGFYWVSKKGINHWEIAQFIESGFWLLMGDDKVYSNEEFSDFEINEKKIIRQF